jgi:DNA-binding SARP family transcriptional activator/tetratricopeptide (TPR) repeat protein
MLEIRLLGPVELIHDGVPVELGRRQERCVLGLLALEPGRVVSADRLIELLWGNAPPPSARPALQSHIARLRSRLATEQPLILTKGAGYVVDIEPDRVDMHRFASLLDEAQRDPMPDSRAGKLAEALSLWRGPLLAGAADDDLRARLNVGLQEQFLLAHELFAEVELANGRHHQLLACLPELLERNPGRERLALLLMHARYRDHDVAGAMTTFEFVRRHLAEELGLDPGPELVELQRALLKRDVLPGVRDRFPATPPARPSVPVPRQLPPDVLGFAGREAELRRLDEILLESETRQPTAVTITALAGTAGIGKTTLAVHWAHRLAEKYPDGALYVNLRGFDPSASAAAPDEALRGFLDALGVPAHQVPASVSARTGLYRSLLDGLRILVVLDNARDADQVRPLLPGSAGCLAILTSRYQLYSLVTAEGAQPLTVGLLSPGEAKQVLTRRIGHERVADEPEAAQSIIDRCAGLPLALALVAARAAAHPGTPLLHLAAELNRVPRPLDAFSSDDASTDARAVFSWSYAAVSLPAAALFRALGLHPCEPIAGPATASLIGGDLAATQVLLSELERANLVTRAGPDRYGMHDLLHAYARELALAKGDNNARVENRMLDHYLQAAHRSDVLLDPHRDPIVVPDPAPGVQTLPLHSHREALAWCVAEHATLLAILDLAAAKQRHEHMWRLAWCLSNYFERQGHWRLWTQTLTAGVRAARSLGDWAAQGRCLRALARARARPGDPARAAAHLDEALGLYSSLGDRVGEAYVHLNFNVNLGAEDRYDEALIHGISALALFRQAGHRVGEALSLNAIGWGHAHLGQPRLALEFCSEALDVHREVGHRQGEADTWDSLGYAYRVCGDLSAAAEAYSRALEIFRDLGDRYNHALAHLCLGDLASEREQQDEAQRNWTSALEILREINHPEVITVMDRLSRRSDDIVLKGP